MGRHDLIDWHDNGSLVWTWPLTIAVSGVALAVLAVGGVLWAIDATGASGAKVFTGLAVPAGVALFVAVSGRLVSANRLRYQDVEFPAVPPASPAPVDGAAPRRRSTGRRSGLAYVWMVITGGGFATAALTNWRQDRVVGVLALVLAACGVGGCYLAGPAARFVVSPEHLYIDTALRRIRVPRHLIAGFARGPLTLTLRLDGGDHLDVRVDSPLWDVGNSQYRTNIRAQLRAAERIVALLRQVPAAAGTGGQVIIAARPGMRVLAIATAVLAVAAVIAFPFATRGG